jgi:predicted nucleotidyltransferase
MKAQLDSNQKAITKKIRALVPDATAIIFHGSRVRGLPSPESDYDVMVFTPTGMEEEERDRIKQSLRREFPDFKVDPMFGTERYLLASLPFEPYPRFWLENGVAVLGRLPEAKPYPRLYRGALDSRLDIIRAEVGVVDVFNRTLYNKARGYLRILKNLVLIENVLSGDYSNDSLWSKVESLVGHPTFEIVRDPSLRFRIRHHMVKRLRRIVLQKISELRKENLRSKWTTSQYPKRTKPNGKPKDQL